MNKPPLERAADRRQGPRDLEPPSPVGCRDRTGIEWEVLMPTRRWPGARRLALRCRSRRKDLVLWLGSRLARSSRAAGRIRPGLLRPRPAVLVNPIRARVRLASWTTGSSSPSVGKRKQTEWATESDARLPAGNSGGNRWHGLIHTPAVSSAYSAKSVAVPTMDLRPSDGATSVAAIGRPGESRRPRPLRGEPTPSLRFPPASL